MKFLIGLLHRILIQGNLGIVRAWVAPLCYYWIPLGLFVYLMVSYFVGDLEHQSEELGNWGMILFFVILLVKPVMQIFPKFRIFGTIVGLRRELGVLCMWFVLTHGFGPMLESELWKSENFLPLLAWDNYLLWGIVGGLGMLILGITSNKVSVKFLKRNWKRLHLIIYPVMIASILHVIFIDIEEYWMYAVLGVVYVGMKLWLWRKKRG